MASLSRCRLRFLAVGTVVMAMAVPALAQDDLKIQTPSVTPDQFTNDGRLSGTDLGKTIEAAIGKDNYQQVTVILSTCHSGAGLAPIASGLGGPHNVIAACGAGQTSVTSIDGTTRKISGVIPGLLDSIIGDPTKPVDTALGDGTAGAARTPKGQTPAERAVWEADQQKRYEANRKAQQDAAKAAHDKAIADKAAQAVIDRLKKRLDDALKRPDWDKGGRDLWVEEPASQQSAGKPGQKPIAAGTKSNHAIIYQPYPSESFDAEAKKAKEAFEKAKFTSVDTLSPMTAADYKKLQDQQAAGQPFSTPGDRATPENLKKKLEALKPKLNAEEALTIIVISHGGLALNSDRSNGGIGPGGGDVFAAANSLDHLGDSFTASLLIEEASSTILAGRLADYSYYERWDQPALLIQTAQETNLSGQPVGVFANGLPLGNISLANPSGGFYQLPFEDDFIDLLIATTDLGNGLDLDFVFGGALDSFKLATAADIAARVDNLGLFGITLSIHLDGGSDIPVPATGLLLAAALAILAKLRASPSHGARRARV